jgi:ribonucleoside-diphosphate reductase alpha chain
VTDEFMRAVLDDGEWQTHAVRDGAVMDTYKARDLMRQIAEGTHGLRRSGHAVRHDDQRLAHLPEHGAHQREQPVLGVHVPRRLGVQPGVDQPDEVRRATTASSTSRRSRRGRTLITAQEIIVDNASYPTPAIEKNSHATVRSASATRTSARC